jgi:hypothetical protein
MKKCSNRITKKFFASLCVGPGYSSCRYYAKRRNQLKTPLNWLKQIAVKYEAQKQ